MTLASKHSQGASSRCFGFPWPHSEENLELKLWMWVQRGVLLSYHVMSTWTSAAFLQIIWPNHSVSQKPQSTFKFLLMSSSACNHLSLQRVGQSVFLRERDKGLLGGGLSVSQSSPAFTGLSHSFPAPFPPHNKGAPAYCPGFAGNCRTHRHIENLCFRSQTCAAQSRESESSPHTIQQDP